MTIAKVQKKFENLKHMVLEDGKIDIVETYAIIDFIEPYVQAGNQKFVRFAALLKKYVEDKVMTEQESEDIIRAMNDVSKFLKVESVVEYVFFGCLGILGIVMFAMFLIK